MPGAERPGCVQGPPSDDWVPEGTAEDWDDSAGHSRRHLNGSARSPLSILLAPVRMLFSCVSWSVAVYVRDVRLAAVILLESQYPIVIRANARHYRVPIMAPVVGRRSGAMLCTRSRRWPMGVLRADGAA